MAGLYVHVPFCKRKCSYCDFYSLPRPEHIDGYVRAAVRNIGACGGRYDTVYFGGGTPSLLTAGQVGTILSAADIVPCSEISMECNPESVSPAYLRELRKIGVNRLSFGVQSLCDKELAALGRLHNGEQAVRAIEWAAEAGFRNISADIMLAVPCQTPESLEHTLDRLLTLPLTHVSAYLLKVEEGTPLSRNNELLGKIPDEDMAADMYLMTARALSAAGFEQYEISNFAKPGHECRHNLNYWRCGEYFGIGPAAHSFLDGKRFYCPPDAENFSSDPLQERISDGMGGGRWERAMLALRLTKEGISLPDYPEAERHIKPLAEQGLLTVSGGRATLAPKGCLVSNEIISTLLRDVD